MKFEDEWRSQHEAAMRDTSVYTEFDALVANSSIPTLDKTKAETPNPLQRLATQNYQLITKLLQGFFKEYAGSELPPLEVKEARLGQRTLVVQHRRVVTQRDLYLDEGLVGLNKEALSIICETLLNHYEEGDFAPYTLAGDACLCSHLDPANAGVAFNIFVPVYPRRDGLKSKHRDIVFMRGGL